MSDETLKLDEGYIRSATADALAKDYGFSAAQATELAKSGVNAYILAEVLKPANKQLEAAKKNLEYQETVTKNQNLIREWKGTVFGIEQVIQALIERFGDKDAH